MKDIWQAHFSFHRLPITEINSYYKIEYITRLRDPRAYLAHHVQVTFKSAPRHAYIRDSCPETTSATLTFR